MPINQLFQTISKNPGAQGAIGGVASGALTSLLMHPKSRKKLGKTAMNVGGAAALAGVGYYAYKKWQSSQTAQQNPSQNNPTQHHNAAPAPAQLPPVNSSAIYQASTQVQVSNSLALGMIKSMIAAAAADGKIDSQEMDALMASMEQANLTPQENAELTQALNKPPTVEEIAATARNPEEASELYAAALSAIDPDTPAEHLYLKRLARSLALDESLVGYLHQSAQT